MKKGLKITAIVLGILLLLMFILPFAFQGKITDLVKKEGNKMLNARFDFNKLSISLFKNFPQASVTLSDFYLIGKDEFANDTLAQAGEITATLNLLSLFGDSGYDVSKIFIENTRFHAIVLPNGKANWDVMKTDTAATEGLPTETEETASAFKIKLQRFVIKHMDVVYDDRQSSMYADMRDFSALCSGDLASDRTTLQLEAEMQSLTYKMNGIPFLSNANIYAKIDVDADLANQKYILKKNQFRLNAIQAGIDGWVAMNSPAVEMDLKLNTSEVGFKEILSLIPAIYSTEFSSLKTDGTATLTGYAKGTLLGDTVPEFNVDLQVKDAMFRYPSLPAGVDQIQINANLHNPGGSMDLTTVNIQPFKFRLAGNPFSLTVDVKTPISDPDFEAKAKGTLDLGMIKQVYPLEDMDLNGVLNADMQLAGRLSFIEKEQYDQVKASGTLSLTGMKLQMKDMPNIEIKKSLFTFTPKYLQLSETTVDIGHNDLTVDSHFENYIGYALKGTTLKGTLNIYSNHLDLNDFMQTPADSIIETTTPPVANPATPDSLATISTEGILEIPRNIDFQMDADLKQMLLGKMAFNNMKGKLVIKDGKVDMKNLSMSTMGGNVVMNGYYSTADAKVPEMNASFKLTDISFAQAYTELDMVQQLAPIFENLKGNFSGQIQVATKLDAAMNPVMESMQGNGSLSTRDLSLSGVKVIDQIADAVNQPGLKEMKVKDMTLDFTIKEGRVATKPFDIKMGDYAINLSGTTGLDQTIDYTGKLKLPASMGNLSKLTTVDMKIGGTFTSPKVSLDTKSMANQAVEAVADKAVQELGKKLGLDSAATANKDSIKQQVKEKVTEKALDFLKKKLK